MRLRDNDQFHLACIQLRFCYSTVDLHVFAKLEGSTLRIGAYDVLLPPSHHLKSFLSTQQYRFLNLGLAAQYLSLKYPKSSVIDVGANIGDTAAMIATFTASKLVLVEPAQEFHDYLAFNASKLPNDVQIIKAIIASGGSITGSIHVREGNAVFVEDRQNGCDHKSV